MNRLSIISDSAERTSAIANQLAGVFETHCFEVNGLPDTPEDLTLVDINFASASHFQDLKLWLKRGPRSGQVIFVVDEASKQDAMSAFAMGATDLLPRPVERRTLLNKLLGDIQSLARNASASLIESSAGVSAGVGALQNIFASASLGAPLDPQAITAAGDTVVSQVAEEGLGRWVSTVRNHHSQTYQHCLIVTGVAVTFGRHLGFSHADQKRLSSASLLHDIGKARIPLAILEKPGPLDHDELAVMREHPMLGIEALRNVHGIHPEMLDAVAHHHEYLDGSGYPHGLRADDLSDLVRVITVADIFGALIERRSYKPPMDGEAAYQILESMGPKLDRAIVREFKPVSKVHF
jgi:putative nucleotidyltransferase with HDIG domain